MKPAKDGPRDHPAEPLVWTNHWRILGQSEMRSHMVVVGSISLEDPAQMVLAQDYDVVQKSRRIEPISLSACPFCQGERGAIGLSRMPIAAIRRLTS